MLVARDKADDSTTLIVYAHTIAHQCCTPVPGCLCSLLRGAVTGRLSAKSAVGLKADTGRLQASSKTGALQANRGYCSPGNQVPRAWQAAWRLHCRLCQTPRLPCSFPRQRCRPAISQCTRSQSLHTQVPHPGGLKSVQLVGALLGTSYCDRGCAKDDGLLHLHCC